MRRLLSAALVVAGATVAACIHGPVVAYPPQTAAGSAAPRKFGDSILHGGLKYVTTNSPGVLAGSGTSSSPLTATIHVDGTTITGTGSAGDPLVGAGGGLSGGVTGDLVDWASPTTVGNYAGTSCATHKATTSFSTAGAATCSTFVDTAGTGLSLSTSTLSLANTTVTPGTYTYPSITVDQQGRLTAASSGTAPVTGTLTSPDLVVATGPHTAGNYAGSTCSGSTVATAISAAGGLTCGITPITGTLTTNAIPEATGPNTLGDSGLSDDGTFLTAARRLNLSGAYSLLEGSPAGEAFAYGETLGFGWGRATTVTGVINHYSYNGAQAQWRDLSIEDGKNGLIAKFTGEGAPDLHVFGTFEADGNTTLGNASSDTTTIAGQPFCAGTAPTVTGCGASPTIAGTNCSGTVVTGSAATSCTIDWAAGPSHTPTCTITVVSATAPTQLPYITSQSTTATTWAFSNGVGAPQTFNYNCGFNY